MKIMKKKNNTNLKLIKYVILSSILTFVFYLSYIHFKIVITPRYYIMRCTEILNTEDIALGFSLLLNANSIVTNGNILISDYDLKTMSIQSNCKDNLKPFIQEITEYSLEFLGSDVFNRPSYEIFNISLVNNKKLAYKVLHITDTSNLSKDIALINIRHKYNSRDNTISFSVEEMFGLKVTSTQLEKNFHQFYKMIMDSIEINELFYINIDGNLYKIIKD